MQFIVDTHTHTVSSGHAYSTVVENAVEAQKKGIQMLAMTDHGPILEGAPNRFFFSNLRVLPKEISGVRILKGVECNIIDYDGKLDLEEKYMRNLEFVLASFHDICIEPSSKEEHTRAFVKVLQNPYVDVIAHPDNVVFPVDIEKVVLMAKEYGKLIEVNNHSFVVRKGSEHNCREFIRLCKKYETKVVCGSDAHIAFDIGNLSKIKTILEEESMPEELILNTSMERFNLYLEERRKRIETYRGICLNEHSK